MLAGSRATHMHDVAAHQAKNWTHALEGRSVAADHDSKLSITRPNLAAGHRSVQYDDALCGRRRRDALGKAGARRRRVDESASRGCGFNKSAGPEIDFLDVCRISDHGDDEFAALRHGAGGFTPNSPLSKQGFGSAAAAVENMDRMPGGSYVRSHMTAHDS
jgi:hypothetical protein